jgi:hypothetical protein
MTVFGSLTKWSKDGLSGLKDLKGAFRGSVKSSRTLSRQVGQLSKINSALGAEAAGAADAARSANKTAELESGNLSRTTGQVKADAAEIKGVNDVGKTAKAEQQIASKGISKTTMFLGVSGAVLISLGLAAMLETDNAKIDILDIDYYTSTTLKVNFNVANGSGGPNFALRPGNTISFEDARIATLTHPSLGDADKQVVKILDDHNFLINVDTLPDLLGTVHGSLPTSSTAPAGQVVVSGTPSPVGSSYWGQARVHSDFMSQFAGATGDGVALVANAADELIVAATPGLAAAAGAAGDSLDALLNAVTPAGLNILDTAAGAGEHAFCTIFPLACNPILWWVLGGICIFIIIVMIAMKLKK